MNSENDIAKILKIISYILFGISILSFAFILISVITIGGDLGNEFLIGGIIAIALMFINALITPAILYAISSIVENTHTTNLILRDALLKDKKFEFELEDETLKLINDSPIKNKKEVSGPVKCVNCVYNKTKTECGIYDIKPKYMST